MHELAREAIEERFLTDECVITEPLLVGEGTFDEATMTTTYPEPAEVYEGCCLVQDRLLSREETEAGAVARVDEMILKLPACEAGFRAGMLVEITDSEDGELTGSEFEVIRVVARSHRGSRRLVIRHRVGLPSVGQVS